MLTNIRVKKIKYTRDPKVISQALVKCSEQVRFWSNLLIVESTILAHYISSLINFQLLNIFLNFLCGSVGNSFPLSNHMCRGRATYIWSP